MCVQGTLDRADGVPNGIARLDWRLLGNDSLSRKALRHYHDLGLLTPAHIDPHSGYRLYDTTQVDLAHIIRRLRELGMPIPDVKALLSADDTGERYEIITTHLQHMEAELQRTKDVVGALRELLTPAQHCTDVVLRHEPSMPVWAVTATIPINKINAWFTTALHRLCDALRTSGVRADGPPGGLFERELFTESRGEANVLIPVTDQRVPPAHIRQFIVPAMDVAVLTHDGSHDNLDRSYGRLGTYVSEHLISDDGPIREHYLDSEPTNFTTFKRTEICWPIFSTAPLTEECAR
jgi:DNA-binding transcriptional MerR regulator